MQREDLRGAEGKEFVRLPRRGMAGQTVSALPGVGRAGEVGERVRGYQACTGEEDEDFSVIEQTQSATQVNIE
jgi:hypothetical protein